MHSGIPGCLKFALGPVPNGTLHVHLRSYGLTMAAACSCQCPLSPRDRRVSHSSFLRSEGSSQAPSIRTSAESTADFYPTVKAALRHKSADSEEDREGLGCHLGQGPSPQQTSTRQSKQHYVTKVRTQRKTARV